MAQLTILLDYLQLEVAAGLASFLTDVADLFLAAAPLEAAGRLEGGLPLFLVAASGVLCGVLDLTEGVDGAELTTVIQPNIK